MSNVVMASHPGQGALTHGTAVPLSPGTWSKYNFENKVPEEVGPRRGVFPGVRTWGAPVSDMALGPPHSMWCPGAQLCPHHHPKPDGEQGATTPGLPGGMPPSSA